MAKPKQAVKKKSSKKSPQKGGIEPGTAIALAAGAIAAGAIAAGTGLLSGGVIPIKGGDPFNNAFKHHKSIIEGIKSTRATSTAEFVTNMALPTKIGYSVTFNGEPKPELIPIAEELSEVPEDLPTAKILINQALSAVSKIREKAVSSSRPVEASVNYRRAVEKLDLARKIILKSGANNVICDMLPRYKEAVDALSDNAFVMSIMTKYEQKMNKRTAESTTQAKNFLEKLANRKATNAPLSTMNRLKNFGRNLLSKPELGTPTSNRFSKLFGKQANANANAAARQGSKQSHNPQRAQNSSGPAAPTPMGSSSSGRASASNGLQQHNSTASATGLQIQTNAQTRRRIAATNDNPFHTPQQAARRRQAANWNAGWSSSWRE